MKQKKMLALTLSQLEQLYRHELPELVQHRRTKRRCGSLQGQPVGVHCSDHAGSGTARPVSKFDFLIEYDGQEVHELSTENRHADINLITSIRVSYRDNWKRKWKRTCSWTLFQQFKRLQQPAPHSAAPHRRIKSLDRTLAQRTGRRRAA